MTNNWNKFYILFKTTFCLLFLSFYLNLAQVLCMNDFFLGWCHGHSNWGVYAIISIQYIGQDNTILFYLIFIYHPKMSTTQEYIKNMVFIKDVMQCVLYLISLLVGKTTSE